MDVSIRPLLATDHESWLPLWVGYLDFYQVAEEDRYASDTWLRLLEEDHIYGLGAFLESGTMVGITHYLFHSDTWARESVCYLQDLYTHPDARGQGVGKALIGAVAEAAAARDCSRVYWLTATDNEIAMKLYGKVASLVPFVVYELDLTD